MAKRVSHFYKEDGKLDFSLILNENQILKIYPKSPWVYFKIENSMIYSSEYNNFPSGDTIAYRIDGSTLHIVYP